MVVMNDWSARDIQKWEYVPLGPFGAKNFATSISPWVVTLDALEPFRCPTSAGEQSDPVPLEYIRDPSYSSYDIKLEVGIQGSAMDVPSTVTRSNFANLYWNIKQQLGHHSVGLGLAHHGPATNCPTIQPTKRPPCPRSTTTPLHHPAISLPPPYHIADSGHGVQHAAGRSAWLGDHLGYSSRQLWLHA